MNTSSKILLLAFFILVGFVFPLAFLGAAAVALTIIGGVRGPKASSTFGRFPPLEDGDKDWLKKIEACTDSPAEVAFLRAMIEAYDLAPDNNCLKGKDLALRLQVDESPYRLDFLVDDALVVEIDGAAWHSSPEARARDAARDQVLRRRGYTIVRIPAKTVFHSPSEAVAAVNKGRVAAEAARKARLKDGVKPKNLISSGASALNTFGATLVDLERRADEAAARIEREQKEDQEEIDRLLAEEREEITRMGQWITLEGRKDRFGAERQLAELQDPAQRPARASSARERLAELREWIEVYKEMPEERWDDYQKLFSNGEGDDATAEPDASEIREQAEIDSFLAKQRIEMLQLSIWIATRHKKDEFHTEARLEALDDPYMRPVSAAEAAKALTATKNAIVTYKKRIEAAEAERLATKTPEERAITEIPLKQRIKYMGARAAKAEGSASPTTGAPGGA